MVSKGFLLLLMTFLIVEILATPPPQPNPSGAADEASPAPRPNPTGAADEDGNVTFEGAPPPCLPPRSNIKFKIQLVLFCLVMVTVVTFLLWRLLPGLRSLYCEWGMRRNGEIQMTPFPVDSGNSAPSPSTAHRPMPTPTAPPIPSPPRVLSCHVCGYPNCQSYVACPYCGKISTLSVI